MAGSVPFLKSVNTDRVWDDEKDNSPDRNRYWFARNWKEITLIISITSTFILSLLQLCSYVHIAGGSNLNCKTSLLSPEIDIERWIPNRWVSDYSSLDTSGMAEVNRNWDAIRAAHGIVAVDHQWAAEKGLPLADSLPNDNTKGVYTLEGYRSLHCLVVVRRTMFQLA
ncbi:hypothetical protein GLAREA_12178 [Glarea lozoyensis ATCC 20868]|uniref:Uncharacterized protein n=1 Tax=Glarea lozoyensis (strain ATCC 20868 / MF5171) TaxID=1116229 RepID=S3DJ79_GLAL2|nr:uncharacterized protein GLAREA_12178 [Glarea lozoyensis ATCC 20868]EPE32096.1 hypothetical protein GLAREA_12178 [Glarea lozoyensis ATCC 20868]